MLYPAKLTTIADGLSIFIPDPELVKPVYENLLLKDPATAFPFWAKIWPSALALASFLKENSGLVTGKRALELGAGIGLPSFTIAEYVSGICISDHAPEAVALLQKNIQYHQLDNATALCIDWNKVPEQIKAEVLLLSDINYAPDQFEGLLHMIHRFVGEGTTIILATPQRITVTAFAEALQPYIKRSVLCTVPYLNGVVDIRILVLSL